MSLPSDSIPPPQANSIPPARDEGFRWVHRTGAAMIAMLLAAGVFGGFLHTRAGHPLLAAMFGNDCPFWSLDEPTDGVRAASMYAQPKDEAAPARPALGFRLDVTTRDDVHAWAQFRKVTCRDDSPAQIQCEDVDPGAVGIPDVEFIEELTFSFRPDGRLASVATLRGRLTTDDGTRMAEDLGGRLYDQLGRARPRGARLGVGAITQASLTQTRVAVRYRDYAAEITAVNLPTSGVAVRERYSSTD
jgi:hypothetical protein